MSTRRRILLALASGTIVLATAATPASAQTAGLRDAADAAMINFGAATTVASLADAAHTALLVDNVNMISTVDEVDFAVVQPQPGVFDFTAPDLLVDFAVAEGLTVRGHGLISRDGLPDWIQNGAWTAETLAQALTDHVTAVVSRYAERSPGVVTQWDVVDEAFLPDGTPRDSIWRRVIGDDYIQIAFEAARAADPDALLFYDDFYDDLSVTEDAIDSGVAVVPGATTATSTCDAIAKCVGVRDAVTALVANGTPIDGIGLQAHMRSPDPLDFSTFSSWIDDAGLRWAVTEFDVPVPVTEIANPETLTFQADTYSTALSACIDSVSCDTFVIWGITDRLAPTPPDGAFGGSLWFDQSDAPKPAADAMSAALGAGATVATTEAPVTTASPSTVVTSPPTTTVVAATSDGSTAPLGLIVGVGVLLTIAVIVILLRRRGPGDPR